MIMLVRILLCIGLLTSPLLGAESGVEIDRFADADGNAGSILS